MSSYLVGANRDPCREAHFSHCLCIDSRVLQISSVLFPYARILASSTNPMTLVFVPGRSIFPVGLRYRIEKEWMREGSTVVCQFLPRTVRLLSDFWPE